MVTGFANDGEYRPSFPTRSESASPDGTTVIAAHEDYGSLVTQSSPAARPGAKVHVYMTGLGQLAREVATGVRGPPEGVLIARSFECTGSRPNSPRNLPG
jgi:uncharacterized protein (TIGR03437 family)